MEPVTQYPATGAAPAMQNSFILVHETLGLNVAPIDITGLLALLDDESLSGYTTEPDHKEEEHRIRGWTAGTIGGAIQSTRQFRYTIHGEKFSLEVDYNKVVNRNVDTVKLERKGENAKRITVTGPQLSASQSVSLLSKCAVIVARTTAKRIQEQQQKFDDVISSIVS